MTERGPDFISGSQAAPGREKRSKSADLSLCYKKAYFQRKVEDSAVITRSSNRAKNESEKDPYLDDGLYSVSDCPLTSKVIKPYPLERQISFNKGGEAQVYGKLLEIAIRDVSMRASSAGKAAPQVTSVGLLFKGKPVCKASQPFNRKLHKLFIRKLSDSSNFSIQVQAQGGSSSSLPLPLPERCVRHKKIEIDFSIGDAAGAIHSGVVLCSASLNIMGSDPKAEASVYLYTPSVDDPNDPRNSFSLAPPRREPQPGKQLRYFLLRDPALCLAPATASPSQRLDSIKKKLAKPPDIVVAEQMFSLLDISVRSWFQERRPLRPSSSAGTVAPKHHAGRKQTFTVSVLRGVEVPVREESALVQPLVEVEWAGTARATSASDGPAPVWQQTLRFEIPASKLSYEHCLKLRLFDQHPVWGLQWLGEARVPLECQRSSQQFERWVGLSSLYSPAVAFGYNQASPGHSFTRVYVLVKLEQLGGLAPVEAGAVDALCKAVQRCLAVPYRVGEGQTPEDAAGLAMLLAPLPTHYGPLTPRQALNLNKVDHYGRTALLVVLLQGLGMQSYVLLGSSQTRKWASFALTLSNSSDVTLWDAESGEHYDLQDNRCSLIGVSRLISYHNIWENSQKSVPPMNMRYDPKASKDWQLLFSNAPAGGPRNVQTVDLAVAQDKEDDEDDVTMEMEESLKQNLSQWRTALELPTIYNRHADAILRDILDRMEDASEPQMDKKELRQLYRAYYMHGFVVRVRYTDLEDLASFLLSTKIHAMTGPIEFALVCYVKKLVGKIRSVWLAVVVLRNRT